MTTAFIDPATLRSRLAEDASVRIVDVRTAAEFGTAHIPGSYHVPLDALGDHCGPIGQVRDEIVLVCQSGARAKQAAEKLASAGVTTVWVLEGGMGAWLAAGGEARTGREKWALERQVRLVAGSIVLASIVASTVKPKLKFLAGGVGAGLTFAAVSNTCMMGTLLAKLPYNQASGDEPETHAVVAALVAAQPAPWSSRLAG